MGLGQNYVPQIAYYEKKWSKYAVQGVLNFEVSHTHIAIHIPLEIPKQGLPMKSNKKNIRKGQGSLRIAILQYFTRF